MSDPQVAKSGMKQIGGIYFEWTTCGSCSKLSPAPFRRGPLLQLRPSADRAEQGSPGVARGRPQ
eukprot:10011882-Alexandrium_andersonii.AAC.1